MYQGFSYVQKGVVCVQTKFTNNFKTGPMEAGVQGVPRHTQYLAVYLVKTKFNQEKFGVRHLCAHSTFSYLRLP